MSVVMQITGLPIGPNRVNRSLLYAVLYFSGPWKKYGEWHEHIPVKVFLRMGTLPTFWAEQIWILRIFIFSIFWTPKFPDAAAADSALV